MFLQFLSRFVDKLLTRLQLRPYSFWRLACAVLFLKLSLWALCLSTVVHAAPAVTNRLAAGWNIMCGLTKSGAACWSTGDDFYRGELRRRRRSLWRLSPSEYLAIRPALSTTENWSAGAATPGQRKNFRPTSSTPVRSAWAITGAACSTTTAFAAGRICTPSRPCRSYRGNHRFGGGDLPHLRRRNGREESAAGATSLGQLRSAGPP